MVLAALAERTGSLWSPAVAHGVWNFAVACLLSLPVSGVSLFHLLRVATAGNAEVTGGGFGPEGSAVLTFLGRPADGRSSGGGCGAGEPEETGRPRRRQLRRTLRGRFRRDPSFPG